DTATPEIYTLSLHDALPISRRHLDCTRHWRFAALAPPRRAGSRSRDDGRSAVQATRPAHDGAGPAVAGCPVEPSGPGPPRRPRCPVSGPDRPGAGLPVVARDQLAAAPAWSV